VAWLTVALLTLAAFGPYTPLAGARTEQLAVYAVLAVGLLIGVGSLRVSGPALLIGALLVCKAAVAALAPAGTAAELTNVPAGSFAAGLDNVLLPLAVLIIGCLLTSGGADVLSLVRVLGNVLVISLCVNTVLAYLSLTQDPPPFLSIFWSQNSEQGSVALRAATTGRFSGIINQPAEAGVLYGIGLLTAIYLYRNHLLRFLAATVMLTIGGLLTASKIFLLLSLPVALWLVWQSGGIRARICASLAGLSTLAIIVIQARVADTPIGGYLPSQANDGLLNYYTAGRFGTGSTLWHGVVSPVLKTSPWFGLGAGGVALPYDNGWIEALVVAGLVGVAVYTAVLVTLVVCWLRQRQHTDPATSRLGGGVLLIVIGGSLGLPVLTANRVATVVWLLIGLLLLRPAARPQEAEGAQYEGTRLSVGLRDRAGPISTP
jgi:hypothetical protein